MKRLIPSTIFVTLKFIRTSDHAICKIVELPLRALRVLRG